MAWMARLFLDEASRLRGAWRGVIALLLCGFFGALLRFPASVLQMLFIRDASSFDARLGLAAACMGTLLATWICCSIEGVPFTSVGFVLNRRWLRECALGTLGGLALILLMALALRLVGGVHWMHVAGASFKGLLLGLPLFLLVALHEEAMFRGYAFQRMVGDLGPVATQGFLAVLFAVAHWGNPGMSGAMRVWASLNIGLAAILLGLAYLKTRSLALPIGIHLGWNWAQGHLLGFGVSGINTTGWWTPRLGAKPDWITGGSFGLEGSVFCTLVCALAILGLLLWKPRPAAQP